MTLPPFHSNGVRRGPGPDGTDVCYGARMGRADRVPDDFTKEVINLSRVRLDSQGYDVGGAYWGTGSPLWCAWCYTPMRVLELYARAQDRQEALKLFKKRLLKEGLCPAKFFGLHPSCVPVVHADDVYGKLALRLKRRYRFSEWVAYTHVRPVSNSDSYLMENFDVLPRYQGMGFGEVLMRRVQTYLKRKGALSLHAALDGSGMVQLLHKVFGDCVTFRADGEDPNLDEAVHVMDVEYGRCLAEVRLSP